MIDLKIDQIAVTVGSHLTAHALMEQMGGEWVEDVVEFKELADDQYGRYQLFFNYDLGIEFEILVWKTGRFWLQSAITDWTRPTISHYGVHVENAVSTAAEYANRYRAEILQAVETTSHTNPFLVEQGRKYRYAIIGTRTLLGADLKFIERIE